jgi:hypothetical protein
MVRAKLVLSIMCDGGERWLSPKGGTIASKKGSRAFRELFLFKIGERKKGSSLTNGDSYRGKKGSGKKGSSLTNGDSYRETGCRVAI